MNDYERFHETIKKRADNGSELFSETETGILFSILSDVQELIALGKGQEATHRINLVKYAMHKQHETRDLISRYRQS